MSICLADFKNTNEIKRLWKLCFNDTDDYINMFFNNLYIPENTVICIEDEIIVSSLQLIPCNYIINKQTVLGNYMCGVCTHPGYRNRGFASKVINYSFDIMNKRNHVISSLIPFNFDFYKKYGYKKGYSYRKFENRVDTTTNFENTIDLQQIKDMYIDNFNNFDVKMLRNENFWNCIIKNYEVYADKSGYIICEFENNELTVLEKCGDYKKICDYAAKNHKINKYYTLEMVPVKNEKSIDFGMVKFLKTEEYYNNYMNLMLN